MTMGAVQCYGERTSVALLCRAQTLRGELDLSTAYKKVTESGGSKVNTMRRRHTGHHEKEAGPRTDAMAGSPAVEPEGGTQMSEPQQQQSSSEWARHWTGQSEPKKPNGTLGNVT